MTRKFDKEKSPKKNDKSEKPREDVVAWIGTIAGILLNISPMILIFKIMNNKIKQKKKRKMMMILKLQKKRKKKKKTIKKKKKKLHLNY